MTQSGTRLQITGEKKHIWSNEWFSDSADTILRFNLLYRSIEVMLIPKQTKNSPIILDLCIRPKLLVKSRNKSITFSKVLQNSHRNYTTYAQNPAAKRNVGTSTKIYALILRTHE